MYGNPGQPVSTGNGYDATSYTGLEESNDKLRVAREATPADKTRPLAATKRPELDLPSTENFMTVTNSRSNSSHSVGLGRLLGLSLGDRHRQTVSFRVLGPSLW